MPCAFIILLSLVAYIGRVEGSLVLGFRGSLTDDIASVVIDVNVVFFLDDRGQ